MGIILSKRYQKDEQINKQIQQSMKKVNAFGNIQLNDGKWRKLGFVKQVSKIKEWKVNKALQLYIVLKVDGNCQPLILIQISNIKFPQLQEIFLSNNNIESIEILSNVYLPQLDKIYLADNHITSIKPLRRCNMPKLKTISIINNNIRQLSFLSQMQTHNLQNLYGEYKNSLHFSIDLNSLFKLQTYKIKSIKFQSLGRGSLTPSNTFYQLKSKNVQSV